jgi:hypothetical protein
VDRPERVDTVGVAGSIPVVPTKKVSEIGGYGSSQLRGARSDVGSAALSAALWKASVRAKPERLGERARLLGYDDFAGFPMRGALSDVGSATLNGAGDGDVVGSKGDGKSLITLASAPVFSASEMVE